MTKKDHAGLFKTGVPDKRRANRQVKNVAHVYVGGKRMTIPQLARSYGGAAMHVLTCLALNRDSDSVPLGSTDLEILAGALPEVPISPGDRIKASIHILERGEGKVMGTEELARLEGAIAAPITSLSTDALLKLLEVHEVEE